jgi:beta-N-acetylhexosaminidase
MAMTAHVVYPAIDPAGPATTSPAAIRLIRETLGFDGLLMTDDLSMKALRGAFEDRARQALAAGCDVVLHCNGDMAEMRGVLAGCGEFAGESLRRANAALGRIVREVEPLDEAAARARFAAAFPETSPS